MLLSSLPPTNFRHILTTSSIAGLLLGSSCQHVSRSFHISHVSPNSRAPFGFSGLAPRRIRCTTVPFFCSSNGFLPVKTSTATIAKEYTSPGFDSVTGTPSPLREDFMISGANHLETSLTAYAVAATVKPGCEWTGANPYSAKRAWPY